MGEFQMAGLTLPLLMLPEERGVTTDCTDSDGGNDDTHTLNCP